mgnify:CR=1 FL=1
MTPEQRQIRHLRSHLRELVSVTAQTISAIDTEMQKPEGHEREKRVAAIMNVLEMAHDQAWHFGLDMPFKRKKVTP